MKKMLSWSLGFKFFWTEYYFALSLLLSFAVLFLNSISFVDAWFLCVSSLSGGGLATVSMLDISTPTFGIFALLMAMGCPAFMLLPTIIFREGKFYEIHQIVVQRKSIKWMKQRKEIVDEYFLLAKSLRLLSYIIVGYFLIIVFVGILLVFLALQLRPNQPELVNRNISRFDSAAFLGLSAFSNVGFAIISDSLVGLANNPFAYVLLTFLILAGNTALPICLRGVISGLFRLEMYLNTQYPDRMRERGRLSYQKQLKFILDNPRRLTTHLFRAQQTKYLGYTIAFFISLQYLFFIAATFSRGSVTNHHNFMQLAGIGYFQTLSTRSAGFCILDLRTLNQGLVLIYAIMMYVSAMPTVNTMHSTEGDAAHAAAPVSKPITSEVSSHSSPEKESKDSAGEVELQTINGHTALATEGNEESWIDGAMGRAIDPSSSAQRHGQYSALPLDLMDLQYNEIVQEISASQLNRKFAKEYVFRHSVLLLLAVILLAFSEDELLSDPSGTVNLWYIIFEVLSAYGSVGLSMGIPGKTYSLCGAFSTFGKVVIMALMLLGKHRGLPNADDEVIDFEFKRYIAALEADPKKERKHEFAEHSGSSTPMNPMLQKQDLENDEDD